MDEIKKNQPQKDLKSKTNSNKKNKNQNWYKYKLTWNIWFLEGLVWNLRLEDKRKRMKKRSFELNCCSIVHMLLPNMKGSASNIVTKCDVWLLMSLKKHEHLLFTDTHTPITFNFFIIFVIVKKLDCYLLKLIITKKIITKQRKCSWT